MNSAQRRYHCAACTSGQATSTALLRDDGRSPAAQQSGFNARRICSAPGGVNSLRGPAVLQIAAPGRAATGNYCGDFLGEGFLGENLGMASKIQQEIHAESSAENSTGGQSLLELAEILDQHKIWVESCGDSGTKADFCGVDLANADLYCVNQSGSHLQQANLL